MFEDSFDKVFKNKQKILFVFSHPDDAEISAGGTIARLVAAKKSVCIVKMTFGNKGSRQEIVSEKELATQRLNEDIMAMSILGLKAENNVYLELPDGAIEDDEKSLEKLVRIVRKFKPEIIVTHNPEDIIIRWSEGVNWINHRDHRNTAKLAVDAAYPYSRDLLFFPHQIENEGLGSHIVAEFLFTDYFDHRDTVAIDVTDYIDTKVKALSAHSSQYTVEDAQAAADFFTKLDDSGNRYERFRYVIAD
ncbi:MAG TPA: PIG-L family deacetylase [Candidatus Saccharimonadales bacterium]|nr:PIG-L family deacetylase [Candidatus Saccharimonadales bacterium]